MMLGTKVCLVFSLVTSFSVHRNEIDIICENFKGISQKTITCLGGRGDPYIKRMRVLVKNLKKNP